MTHILHIDASARTRSLSRALSRNFVDTWLGTRPGDQVTYRDLGANPPPATTEPWIAAAFTKPAERTPAQVELLGLSDAMVDEIIKADIIVLGTPMYNYGMPAALKAWVDQIARVGRTFSFDLARGDFPIEPILNGKTMVLLTACGEFGFEVGGVRESMNHLATHVETVKHYFGVQDIHHLQIEYQEFGGERHAQSISNAHAAVRPLVERLIGTIGTSINGQAAE
jgi:FMN-dependent NADH-azoreductase